MTQSGTDDGQDASTSGDNGADRADSSTGSDVGELLDQVRSNVLQFLADEPRPPSNLRVQAGEVSVDIKWPEQPSVGVVGAAGSESAPAVRAPAPATEPEPESAGSYLIAQTVGVFYTAPEPGAAPFVSEGDTVIEGQQVGIIEAMKLMIPVEADRAGRITKALKDNAEPVEYGDRLFALAAVDAA